MPTRRITSSPLPEPRSTGEQGPDIPIESDAGPGFEVLPDRVDETDPIGPDEWYDIDEADMTPPSEADPAASDASAAFDEWDSTRNRIIAGIAFLVLLLVGVSAMMWRRRRREALVQGQPSSAFASGIRNSIANQMPSLLQDAPEWAKDGPRQEEPKPQSESASEPEKEEPLELDQVDAPEFTLKPETEPEPETGLSEAAAAAPLAPEEPARIDLDLAIESATRSFMMFTVEFRLEVANRSNRAVRELTIAAKLDSAQRGGGNAAPIAGGQPIAEIARIGPQQSQRIAGTLQLPLAEVRPIRQGTKPLLIPLMHITLEGYGLSALNRSFVLGTPSEAGTGRVHPLPLDTPVGSLPPLRAQAIKQPGEDDTQSTETV
ncbi:MAG: hypothetical protein ACX930_05810 [Erythrobacter sp.]